MNSEFTVKSPLSPILRKQLERAIVSARDVAETGARVALTALAVHDREPYQHMNLEQRALRKRLRAHGRQLGDRRHANTGSQGIDNLVHECAYEHWHSMLFARFLSENDLLIEPTTGIAVTLEECDELAQEEGLDRWTLATRYAHRMLPQVFRPNHPAFEVQLPREHRLKLEQLVEGLPTAVFDATDSLGWVYQFWQSKKKAEVNNSEQKIGADQLAAVTQLFTEPYIVDFLLHNSLGAWWHSRFPDRRCPVALTYLRTKDDGSPMSGCFKNWPEDLSEFRLLDPCCGSGHFLVAAFLMLVPMRMALEDLSPTKAASAVLHQNLHGLELDQRCVALAAFALALEAWRYPGAGGYRVLPRLHLAWCGQPVHGGRQQWIELAGGETRLQLGLTALYDTFQGAPTFGSLINPTHTVSEDLFTAGFAELGSLLMRALSDSADEDSEERTIAAYGLTVAARLLTNTYHAVVTNVPYLGREKHVSELRSFLDDFHPLAKYDVATAFIERTLEFCKPNGHVFLVLPQYWLFLSRYERMRRKLLQDYQWRFLVTLGPGAFETISGQVVNTCLLSICHSSGNVRGNEFAWLDVSKSGSPRIKDYTLHEAKPEFLGQRDQLENPTSVVGYVQAAGQPLLEEFAYSYQGLATSDNPQFVLKFWEIKRVDHRWVLFQFAPETTDPVSGCSHVLLWEEGSGKYADHARALKVEGRLGGWRSGHAAWGKRGVAINRMGRLPASLYFGTKFDCNVAVVIPYSEEDIAAVWRYCSSLQYSDDVRKINGKLSVTNATLAKVPFDRAKWEAAIQEQSTSHLFEIETADPSQWAFHGHPAHTLEPLQVAVARLLGYFWPPENTPEMQLSENSRVWIEDAKALHSLAVSDGIVCIPSVLGQEGAEVRLLRILETAWGDAWNDVVVEGLLADSGASSLDDWLRNHFFAEHCTLFHHRPFIWHVWDGRKRDGFHALVNYHKLSDMNGSGRRLLESLTYSYLGDWIARRREELQQGKNGAEARLVAALELERRLVAILAGEPPFDIFVRWKSIDEQAIGWEPDIVDGVRLNIRPLMADDVPGGRRGAGILRSKPRLHWKDDRGREPSRDQVRFPWFWKDGDFVGVRVNSVNLTNAKKQGARSAEWGSRQRSQYPRTSHRRKQEG